MDFFLDLLKTGFGTAVALGVIYLAILVVKWRTHEKPVQQQQNPFDDMMDSGVIRVPDLVSRGSCDAFRNGIKAQLETIGQRNKEEDRRLEKTVTSLQITVAKLDKTVAVLEDREKRKSKIDG